MTLTMGTGTRVPVPMAFQFKDLFIHGMGLGGILFHI
jgi:hypothetical protein